MTPPQVEPVPVEQAVAKPAKPTPSAIELAKEMLYKPNFLSEIRNACPKSLTPERIARCVLTAALGSKNLQACFTTPHGRASVAAAVMKSAQRGLEIDGRQGHLVPFFNSKKQSYEVQFIPGYQGLIDLAYNHPKVQSIWTEVVYETDTFHYELGLNRTLIHNRNDEVDNPGQLVAVYAVCKMVNGGSTFVVLKKREIDKIRAFSRGAADPGSVWNLHPEAMWMKSAIRALCKWIPQSAELQAALQDDNEVIDVTPKETPSKELTARSLLTGDTTKALPAPVEQENFIPEGQPQPEAEAVPRRRRSRAQSMVAQEDNIPMGDGAPEPAVTPTPHVATPSKTPQNELQDLVIRLGHNFDDLVNGAIEAGQLPDSTSATCFEELPTEFCAKMVANKQVLAALIIK